MSTVTNRISRRDLIVLIIIFIISIVFRLAYVFALEIESPLRADALKYFSLAFNLLNHNIYSFGQSEPLLISTLITPGYPLFLSFVLSFSKTIGSFNIYVLVVQAVISSFSTVLIFLLAKKIIPYWGAILCAGLVVISPHLNVLSGYVLTETLFIFLLLLGFYLFVSAVDRKSALLFFISGLAFGAGALVRPILVLLPVVLILVSLKHYSFREFKGCFLVLLIGLVITLTPWQIFKFNQPESKEISLLAAAISLGSYPDLIYKDPKLKGFPYKEDPENKEMSRNPAYALSVIMDRASKEPAKYLKWYFWGKGITYWQSSIIAGQGGPFIYPVESSIYHKNKIALASLKAMFFLHPFFVSVALLGSLFALIGLCRKRAPSSNTLVSFLSITVFYFMGVHMVLAPLPRYSIPMYPFVFILGVYFLCTTIGFLRKIIPDFQKIRRS